MCAQKVCRCPDGSLKSCWNPFLCSDVQTQLTPSAKIVFSRAKAQLHFQSIESVLVFCRAVSAQALDNILFDGVQWLTRPNLSPRPLMLSSPHALPCKTKRTQTSTHWLMCTHTHAHSRSFCILPLEDSGSCLCYWTAYHITAGTPPGSERKSPPAFSRKARSVWGGKTRREARLDKNMLKCFCTTLVSFIQSYSVWPHLLVVWQQVLHVK